MIHENLIREKTAYPWIVGKNNQPRVIWVEWVGFGRLESKMVSLGLFFMFEKNWRLVRLFECFF